MLCRSYLVMLGLCRNSKLPQSIIKLFHKVVNSWSNSTKVVFFKLLTFARMRSKKSTTRQNQVLTHCIIFFFDQKIFLLSTNSCCHARNINTKIFKRFYCLMRNCRHRPQQRSLFVKRLSSIRTKCCWNTKHLIFDKSIAGRIPCRITARFKCGTNTTRWERRRIWLSLDKLLARKSHDSLTVYLRIQKCIVLF